MTELKVFEVLAEVKKAASEYSDLLCDYSESAYICDAISEIADSHTSIYYSDIMQFISNNPEALADVVSEGLYEVNGRDYDLYKHGQAAEYMTIERCIYDDLENALKIYALDYIGHELNRETIPAEVWEEVENDIENDSYKFNRLWDIKELVNQAITETEE